MFQKIERGRSRFRKAFRDWPKIMANSLRNPFRLNPFASKLFIVHGMHLQGSIHVPFMYLPRAGAGP